MNLLGIVKRSGTPINVGSTLDADRPAYATSVPPWPARIRRRIEFASGLGERDAVPTSAFRNVRQGPRAPPW